MKGNKQAYGLTNEGKKDYKANFHEIINIETFFYLCSDDTSVVITCGGTADLQEVEQHPHFCTFTKEELHRCLNKKDTTHGNTKL
jgi:hypothetical protein